MSFLDSHERGCSSLVPCLNCQAVSFLKQRLGYEQYDEFLLLLGLETQSERDPLSVSVDILKLPPRILSCLRSESIYTVRVLLDKTREDLLKIPNLGAGSWFKIRAALWEYGELKVKPSDGA